MPRVSKRLFLLACIAVGMSLAAVAAVNVRSARKARHPSVEIATHAAIARATAAILEALHRSDPHAYAEHFADDALSLPGLGPIVRGRESIAAAMGATFAKIHFVEAEMSTLDARIEGDTVFETGRYRYVVSNNRGHVQTLSGRYAIVWKRDGDRWKIALDAAQPGAPPQ